ncbi:MAG: excinuclease ABC subunit UvrC [Flavobacteriales bacterium]|nr:excinuclease ABC subunit UvrC [Flavobacteriales bacterium]
MPIADITKQISYFPNQPGVYRFYNSDGKIIYVGKAKDLKKRVSSYFTKQPESGKTALMIKQIADIKTIVVNTEVEALLLENTLIKEFKPRYNILLKDDKTYPWICIKKERFPRVFSTRHLVKDGSQYFGPYASVRTMKTLLDLLKQLYKLRTCSYQLSEENIKNNKFKVCLEYHLGNCKAPCEGLQTEKEYNEYITQIKEILKGNIGEITKLIKQQINECAEKLQFEEAQVLKEKLERLQNYQNKTTVVSSTVNNVDVFSFVKNEGTAFINYMKVNAGAVVQSHSIELKTKLEETDGQLLDLAIVELRQRFQSNSTEIILPFLPDTILPDVQLHIPQRGDKKRLLELSDKNAVYFMNEKLRQAKKINPQTHHRILEKLKTDLNLSALPVHIECFDNSNMQGTNAVSACVVFKNGKPSKKDYRHFNIKTVEGPNDFASMEEAVYRRYKRMCEEKMPLPQLIIIDGGKGQLSSALTALIQLNLSEKIKIIGIAKRLEEIFFPGESIPLYIDKRSESLKLIQYLRNEAHRFGLKHYRSKHSKQLVVSELDHIKGIGEKSKQALLQKFKSIARLKEAEKKEIAAVIGIKKTEILIKTFEATP